MEVIAGLAQYGFIVNTIASDGASENRSANKKLATLTANDVLVNHPVKKDELMKVGFPMNMKVAFPHPSLSKDGVIIFIDSDMPHLIKKFVNALERSSSSDSDTDLHFRGHKLSLKMLHQLWCASGSNINDSIRNVNKLTKDHFFKNNYSRMRVHLAVQICSKNVVNMIDDYAQICGGKVKYGPMREVILLMNNFIDIMNGRKKVDCFSSPNDPKLDELMKLVSIFSEWKNESGSNKNKFITTQSYEDLCWIVFAKVGVCTTYLKDDNSLLLVPGHSGSDIVEHHFGHIRQTNTKPSILECKQATARGSDIGPISNMFSINSKSNTSGSDVYASEAFCPMKSNVNKKRKYT